MKALIDFDSVLSCLGSAQIRSCNAKFGTSYRKEDIVHWQWWYESVPKEQSDFVWGDECFRNRDWCISTSPVEGSLRSIRDLERLGDELVVVSDRREYMKEWIEAWLRVYGFPEMRVIVSGNGGVTKSDVSAEEKFDYAVDDSPNGVLSLAKNEKYPKRIFLFSQPWNKDMEKPLPDRVERVSDWYSVVKERGRQWG